ncbi:MAG: VWA domain-containing protein [Akkermansiaceae bacterium]
MSFAQPGWLALLILIPVLGLGAILASRLRKRQWEEFVAPRLRAALIKRGSSLPRWLSLFFLLTACLLLIVALARPQGDAGVRTEKSLGRNVLVALDLSRSMRVSDVKPDRLSQAKVVIYELLEAMPNERIGLIGFAGSAYVYAPLTIDHSAVRETVDQIDESWATKGGSDLASAVRLATETLKQTGQKNNALVILSDGEKHDGDLDAMVAEAEKSGVYILAVGVGTEDGGFVPNPDFPPNGQLVDKDGRPVISRLQSEVMRKLAADTKGRFAIAGSGMDIPNMVKSVIKDLDAFELEGRERRVSIEFYQWLMLPVILFLIVSITAGTRWRGIRAPVLIAFAFFIPQDADASDASDAKQALAEKRYEMARDAYRKLAKKSGRPDLASRYRLGEATAAYRAGDFRGARSAFSHALLSESPDVRAQAHLGAGNSLFQLGWQGLSGKAYPTDPAAVPDLDRFDTIVKELLAKLRETEAPEDGETNGYVRIESLITNWADSVRHYNSAVVSTPNDKIASRNRELTMTYLKRLRELLEQEKQDTEQSMPEPQPGEGEPQEGEGEPGEGEPEEGEGEGGDKKPEGEGDEEKDGKSGDKGEDPNGKSGKNDEEQNDSKKGERDPNESPEERATRLLKENADLEKGPLSPGRREFRDPEKDW